MLNCAGNDVWYVHSRVCIYPNDSITKLLYYICMYECIGVVTCNEAVYVIV